MDRFDDPMDRTAPRPSLGTWEWHNLHDWLKGYSLRQKLQKNGLYTTETATIFSHQNVTYTNSAPRYTGQAPKLPVMMDIQNRICKRKKH